MDGLEPDNLLAFLALLGLLRALEEVHPAWRPRVGWTVDEPPVRPVLTLSDTLTKETVTTAVASGLTELARRHDFEPFRDLKLSREETAEKLVAAAHADQYTADLWAALVSDAAVRERNKAEEVEPTPLCLLFGQGHQHFLERLSSVPQETTPPLRRVNGRKSAITEVECLCEALFVPWTRPDATRSFRWDPHEDVRYALRATDPTDSKTKETTQHGANRLAAVGLSVLTVVPRNRGGVARLDVIGGSRVVDGSFVFTWPIWRESISLATIRSLLGHQRLDDASTRAALSIFERRRARRISSGKFMNFTRAESIPDE
ncbi:MAG: hypothetical protein OXQ31_15115 [Spirochaetaceae bacterium]|nr:hypothetical protein [Spirochaetaceae bacterium]MDE0217950.1 hypothetical protein [Spirochaetaceae bacterium]